MKGKLLLLAAVLFVGSLSAQVLDVNFGANGIVSTAVGGNTYNDLKFQPDGKIVVANGLLMRYNVDGSLDTDFGVSGFFSTEIGDRVFYPSDIAVQSDGKIVVGGALYDSGSNLSYTVFRVDTNGQIDLQFGNGGNIVFDDGTAFLAGIAVQGDGKIIIAGDKLQPQTNNRDIVIQRFNPNGTQDNTYGNGGTILMNFGEVVQPENSLSHESVAAIALLPDNSLLVSGSTDVNSYHAKQDFFVCKFDSTGAPDASFGQQGKAIVNFMGNNIPVLSNDYAMAMDVDFQGRVIVAGQSNNVNGDYFVMLALDADGNLDTGFGDNGKIIQTIDYEGYPLINVQAVKTDAAGRIFACGKIVQTISPNFQAYRLATAGFTSDGAVNPNFGNDGVLLTDFGTLSSSGHAMGIDPDQNLVVGGYSSDLPLGINWVLARYNTENLKVYGFQKTTFAAYPNPFVNDLWLDFTLPQDEFLSISLSDISGKKYPIFTDLKAVQGKQSLHLDLPSGLSSGVYFLQINHGQDSTVFKVVK